MMIELSFITFETHYVFRLKSSHSQFRWARIPAKLEMLVFGLRIWNSFNKCKSNMQRTKRTFWTMENSRCIWKCRKSQNGLKNNFCLKLLSWDNGIHPYSYNCTPQELTAKTREKWWLETTSLPFGKLRPIFSGKSAVCFREGTTQS